MTFSANKINLWTWYKEMKNLRINNINRKNKIYILVNGNKIEAYDGETVLAALIAAGYKSLHKNEENLEPRGALCGMGVCFECRVNINGVPNIRACMTDVQDGMEILIDSF